MFQTSSGCFSDESINAERNLPLVSRAKRMGLSDFRQTNQGISLTYLPRVSTVNISQKLNFLSFPVARRVLWPPLSFFNCNHRIKIHHLGKFLKFSWVCFWSLDTIFTNKFTLSHMTSTSRLRQFSLDIQWKLSSDLIKRRVATRAKNVFPEIDQACHLSTFFQKLNFLSFPVARRDLWSSLIFWIAITVSRFISVFEILLSLFSVIFMMILLSLFLCVLFLNYHNEYKENP